MRVPISSFRETVPLYVLVLVYIPVCNQKYRAPRTSSIHGSSNADIRSIIVSRDKQCPCTYTHTGSDWQYEHKQYPQQQQQCKHPKCLEYLRYSTHCTPLYYTTSPLVLKYWYSGFYWYMFYKKLKNVSCEYDRLDG